MNDNNYNKVINFVIKGIITGLVLAGIGCILGSIWCTNTAQNILIGVGSGFLTSAIIAILFELRACNERKSNSGKVYSTLLQELMNFISLFVFYLYFFIDNNEEEKKFTDFLQYKRKQIDEFLKIKIEQNKEVTDFQLLYDHISISTCERTEIKKSIDRAHEISAIYFSAQIINDMQFRAIERLYKDFYAIIDGMKERGNLAITAFCFFLDDVANLLSTFKELEFYNRLIFTGIEKKGVIIRNKDNLTELQKCCLTIAM